MWTLTHIPRREFEPSDSTTESKTADMSSCIYDNNGLCLQHGWHTENEDVPYYWQQTRPWTNWNHLIVQLLVVSSSPSGFNTTLVHAYYLQCVPDPQRLIFCRQWPHEAKQSIIPMSIYKRHRIIKFTSFTRAACSGGRRNTTERISPGAVVLSSSEVWKWTVHPLIVNRHGL